MAEIKLTGQIEVQRLFGSIAFVPSEGGGGPLQAKTAFPSHSEQVIAPDEDFYGLVSVIVKPVPRVKALEMAVTSAGPIEVADTLLALPSALSVTAEDAIFEWEVVDVEGASYGFALNDAGYYESQNKGVASSCAICKIMFSGNIGKTITLSCINYAEKNYDYGLVSNLDTMLTLTNTADTSGVYKDFKSQHSSSVVAMSVNIPAGEHFICVKFIKDGGGDQNNDSLQFRIS